MKILYTQIERVRDPFSPKKFESYGEELYKLVGRSKSNRPSNWLHFITQRVRNFFLIDGKKQFGVRKVLQVKIMGKLQTLAQGGRTTSPMGSPSCLTPK